MSHRQEEEAFATTTESLRADVYRADSEAGKRVVREEAEAAARRQFTPITAHVSESSLPLVDATDYVMAPPAPQSARVPFVDSDDVDGGGISMDSFAAYTGGPAYQSAFLAATPLGAGASAAPFYRGSESYASLTSAASTQLTLDTHTGAGVMHRQRQAMAPLFAPVADLSYAYGAPNQLDAVRDREYVSKKQNGVRPAPQMSEGRGLTLDRSFAGMAAEQGAVGPNNLVDYQPRGTYVDALAARDLYADRTVDELRTANNPKAPEHFMAGFEGPAVNTTAGGRLDDGAPTPKNRPDTFFENVMGLWRAPTAFRHTQSVGPDHVVQPYTQRHRTEEDEGGSGYFGAAGAAAGIGGGGVGAYVMEKEYEPSHRAELGEMPLGQVDALTRSAPAAHNDYSRFTQPIYDNNRTSGPQQLYLGATFSSVLGKFIAPIADALRPARRTVMAEAGNDTHGFGQFAGTGVGGFGSGTADSGGRGLPAEYLLPATLKDEGMVEDYFGQATATEAQLGAHHDQNARLRATEREATTAHSGYLGAAQGQVPAEALPSAQPRADRQREQTLQGRMQQGSTDKFNPNVGSIGHRKPDAAAPQRAPTASFVASVPSSATFGAVVSRYDHTPAEASGALGGGQKKRPRALASANDNDSGGGGGVPFKIRGTASRAKHPTEHNFTSKTELDAQMRSRLQERNPLMPATYRVN